jgi:hypothetical protein
MNLVDTMTTAMLCPGRTGALTVCAVGTRCALGCCVTDRETTGLAFGPLPHFAHARCVFQGDNGKLLEIRRTNGSLRPI